MLDQAVLQTLEYAVSSLHVSLLVVLSHQHCAAVAQAEKELDALTEHLTHEITDAQERERIMEDLDEVIASSSSEFLKNIRHLRMAGPHGRPDSRDDYEQVHIAHTIEQLVTSSEMIRDALAHERLMIVGAATVSTRAWWRC